MIATSREPLRVRGETVWRVPPLELPAAAGELTPGELAEHEAIRLFADRAAAVRPGFALDAANAPAVARLCRTLDGIPLAIELAAARVGALSVEQIAARLGDRFRLLASGRPHRPAAPADPAGGRGLELRAADRAGAGAAAQAVGVLRLEPGDGRAGLRGRGDPRGPGARPAGRADRQVAGHAGRASWTATPATGCWTPSGSTPPAG